MQKLCTLVEIDGRFMKCFSLNMNKKQNRKIPPELLAARKANRELERLLLGDGIHARKRVKKNQEGL